MSDIDSRRINDVRMDKLEKIVEIINRTVTDIKIKIFNGFDKSITGTEEKINFIDKENKEQHKRLISDIGKLSKKFDKMLWFLMASSISITSFIIVSIIKGWL